MYQLLSMTKMFSTIVVVLCSSDNKSFKNKKGFIIRSFISLLQCDIYYYEANKLSHSVSLIAKMRGSWVFILLSLIYLFAQNFDQWKPFPYSLAFGRLWISRSFNTDQVFIFCFNQNTFLFVNEEQAFKYLYYLLIMLIRAGFLSTVGHFQPMDGHIGKSRRDIH